MKPSLLPRQNLSVTLLGPAIEHRDSLTAMLAGRVGQLTSLSDSRSFRQTSGAGEPSGVRAALARLVDQVRGTHDPEYVKYALDAIDQAQSNIVIAYWGTLPLPDLAMIHRLRPRVKLVLMVLCYPLALTASGINRQKFYLRIARRHLNGIIYSSDEMAAYFSKQVFGSHGPAPVVLPPCWPAAFQAHCQPQSVSSHSNLIFPGRTDLSGRTVHAADDIRPLMRALLESNIELHHASSPETEDGHPLRKPFASVALPGLIEKMGGFDASLLAYNTEACARDDRFQLTVPDRLITSVAAGVPIAIPARGYSGAKSYLKEYPAVIEFDSASDLAAKLSSRDSVSRLRDAAWSARKNYTAEAQGELLAAFLQRLS